MPSYSKITSLQNQSIKRVVKLRDSRTRRESGLIIVEGLRELTMAKNTGICFEELFFCPEFISDRNKNKYIKEISDKGTAVLEVTDKIFEKIAFGHRHEGMLGICRQPKRTLDNLEYKKDSLFVVVENIEKPGNLGAIVRTCDGAGIDGVIVCDRSTDIYNPNVIRSSIGTIFCVKVIQSSNQRALTFLKSRKCTIYTTSPYASTPYSQIQFKGACAIVLGSEKKGVSNFWIDNSDIKVAIPMSGQADSLNVSTTAAIVIFEAVRQRKSV